MSSENRACVSFCATPPAVSLNDRLLTVLMKVCVRAIVKSIVSKIVLSTV